MNMCVIWIMLPKLTTLLAIRNKKAATALLRDAIEIRDFSVPIAAPVSKILGPISRHLMAQILTMICDAARASRPGIAVGILRVLCNGMCTAQRFHVDDEEQKCRVGCPGGPDSLSHYYECPLLYNFVIAAWRNAAVRPRIDHLFHDLVTQTLSRSFQYGIVVVGGVIDAFVHAHNCHRRNSDNPGNFGDCMEGRIRLMTAITLTYAHAHQSLCLAGRPFVFPHQRSRMRAVRVSDFETIADWGAVARYPDGR